MRVEYLPKQGCSGSHRPEQKDEAFTLAKKQGISGTE